MKNLSPEKRLEKYRKLDSPDGIEAMLEIIPKPKQEHQKSIKEFVK